MRYLTIDNLHLCTGMVVYKQSNFALRDIGITINAITDDMVEYKWDGKRFVYGPFALIIRDDNNIGVSLNDRETNTA